MKAMPVSGGKFFNNSVIASSPPADAPIATIGKEPLLRAFFTGGFFLLVSGVDSIFCRYGLTLHLSQPAERILLK
jgi:hypothetical protein